MKKRHLLVCVVAFILASATAAGGAASDREGRHGLTYAAQPTREICYVNGKFYLTTAEGLRRIGSWTDAASASDTCPSGAASILTVDAGLGRVGAWATP